MHNLLDGLDLAKYPFMMYTGESALAPLAMVAAAVKAQGKDVSALHGVIGGSPLTQLLTDGKNKESLEKHTTRWQRPSAGLARMHRA